VTCADPGQRFAFNVTFVGLSIASWQFDLAARDGGCQVTERAVDRRSWPAKLLGVVGTGVTRRDEHNRRTMEQTLDALARALDG
jgi:hypothetical protein